MSDSDELINRHSAGAGGDPMAVLAEYSREFRLAT